MAGRDADEGHAGAELELLEDVPEMRAHRVRRGEQPRCHFAVNQTLDDQAHDRQLGVGRRGQAAACGRSGGQATADPSERGRRRTGLASRDMPARCRSPGPAEFACRVLRVPAIGAEPTGTLHLGDQGE